MIRFICFLIVAVSLYAGPPTALAIRNARIVTVSGPVIEKGTVVVRDGLIEAVGANIAIPADAWIVEGEKLTVYPGLIDALSTVGMPERRPRLHRAPAAPGAPPQPRTRIRGPEDRPSCTSWLRAADQLNPADRRIEQLRSLGFTTAVIFPTRGIFAGQGAVVNLAGEKARHGGGLPRGAVSHALDRSGSPAVFPDR